jgi:aminopeptidase N
MSMTKVALATALLLAGTAGLAVSAGAQAVAPPQPLAETVPSDLPRVARPLHYTIAIEPDATKLTFTGQSSAEIAVFAATSELTLHAVDLAISQARLVPAAGGAAIALKIALDPDGQLVRFIAPQLIAPGRYTLITQYSGPINTQANGLFALDYNDAKSGEPRRGLFTQFEAPDARRFAPLFDEPSYKATFDLSAIVPAAQMAVSNMPIAREEPLGGGRKRVTFATSPKMSSYLLFFGLGDFERIAQRASNGTEVGVVVPAGKKPQGKYALDTLAQLVPYYSTYFAQPYPLPKLDEVTGPGQSQFFGAMENWGAIFTFEYFLLDDPALTSARGRQGIFTGVAHETAHQWFGDLVTMAWWDDLWLNEGFASWMETKASDHFNPTWGALLDRIGGREAAMGLDGFATTHPIVQHIRTVEETNQAFDTITYSKGEAVIAMLEAYAGANVWRDGLRAYMKDRAYGNATTQDLWRAVEAAGAPGLTAIANDFTTQPGVPLIRVAEARCVGGSTRLVLEQGQFSSDRRAQVAARSLRWRVPLLLTPLGGKPQRTVLNDGRAEASVAGCGPVVVNGGQLGYFRTLYPAAALAALAKALPRLAPIDQLGLVKDNLALSRAGYQAMAPALDLLAAVPARGEANVAAGAVEEWGKLYDSLAAAPAAQASLGKLIAETWRPRMTALGYESRAREILPQAQLRAAMIAMLGKLGDPTVAFEARRRFARLAADPRALDGPLKTAWLQIVAANATRAEWDALATLAKSSPGLVERSTYFGLLARASDPALAQAALDLALTQAAPQTTRAAMIAQVAQAHGDLAFAFAMAHRSQVAALIDDSAKASYFARLAATAQKPETIAALEAYAAGLKPDQRKPVDRILGQIRQRLADSAAQVAGTKAWLAARKQSDPA